ncbi:glycosyltransferase family 1 protein [Dyella ginsengisoli]|uniref:Glycosyltransferase family 1 protein n=1 Tax=Dyella ginsengisoli TaxID=363848 RepID=A0ABW8JRD7_9GAMM
MHIVIATVGSLGDLFPFLAVGRVLARRGHRVTVATHEVHSGAVEQAGMHFADASGMPEPDDRAAFTAKAFHPWRGPAFVVRDFAAADVRASYQKLAPVCAGADLLITSTLAFAGQILGETGEAAGRLRWLSAVLAPASFLSAYDMPVTGIGMVDALVRHSPTRGRVLQWLARRVTHGWTAPVRAFRRELGLPAQSPLGDPFHRGQHAPRGVLALFPALFGAPQPDWPQNVHLCGFARYAQPVNLPPALAEFLDAGAPPLVFSLGSTAVHANAAFLRESLQAARSLGRRAVLCTGSAAMRATLPGELPASVHCVDYAPHAQLFPRASVVVHHGGIGTSAEALCAGVPMLVVPHGFDQPDNAARLARLGVAQSLPATRYRADRAAGLLTQLHDPACRARARALAASLAGDGAVAAADRVEAALT